MTYLYCPTPTLTGTTINSLSSVNGGSSITLTASKLGTANDVITHGVVQVPMGLVYLAIQDLV